MTENEAIEILKDNFPKICKKVDGRYKGGFDDTECEFGKALLLAIDNFEEVKKYRGLGKVEFLADMKNHYVEVLSDLRQYQKIGTVEECREAIERQRAKKPVEYEDKYYACPVCNNVLMHKWEKYPLQLKDKKCALPYCLSCGQAIVYS